MRQLIGAEGDANEDPCEAILHRRGAEVTASSPGWEERWSRRSASDCCQGAADTTAGRPGSHSRALSYKDEASIPPSGMKSRGTLASAPRGMDKNVQSCPVLNSKNPEITRVPTNQRTATLTTGGPFTQWPVTQPCKQINQFHTAS